MKLFLKGLILGSLTFGGATFGATSICDLDVVKEAIKITANGPVTTQDGVLRSVTCEYSTVIYDYLFNDETAELFTDIDAEKNKESQNLLQDMLNFMYCDESGFVYHFNKENVPIIFRYSTAQKDNLFNLRADRHSCKKFRKLK